MSKAYCITSSVFSSIAKDCLQYMRTRQTQLIFNVSVSLFLLEHIALAYSYMRLHLFTVIYYKGSASNK